MPWGVGRWLVRTGITLRSQPQKWESTGRAGVGRQGFAEETWGELNPGNSGGGVSGVSIWVWVKIRPTGDRRF